MVMWLTTFIDSVGRVIDETKQQMSLTFENNKKRNIEMQKAPSNFTHWKQIGRKNERKPTEREVANSISCIFNAKKRKYVKSALRNMLNEASTVIT